MNKKLIISNIFLILLMLCTSVYAAINANLNLKGETSNLKAGDEFTVTLSLKDLTGITSGVDSIQGYINIDENVLEKITFDNIVKDSSDKIKIGSETVVAYDVNTLDTIEEYGLFFNDKVSGNDYKIVIDLKNKITTQDLVSIKFKLKSDVKVGDYSDVIKYEMFTVTEGVKGQSDNLSKSLGIKVVEKTFVNNVVNVITNKVNTVVNNVSNKVNTTTNKINTVINVTVNDNKVKNETNTNKYNTIANTNKINNVNNSVKLNVSISNKTDNTVSNKIIPAAGVTSTVLKVIIVMIIIGFAIYVKYKKYKQI